MAIDTYILSLLLSFLLCSSITTITTIASASESIFLDCGATFNQTSTIDGRAWQADSLSSFIPSNAKQISELSSSITQPSSLQFDQIPYMTARIIHSEFTYTFPNLSTGSKFLRLYFYPSSYTNKNNKTEPLFSVTANQDTLLSNFSALLNLPQKYNPPVTLIKEYIIHINEYTQELRLTFLPNDHSFSFVNGIEIVSIPNKLYHRGDNVQIPWVKDGNQSYFPKDGSPMETMYRLNVGGTAIGATNDTDMFRNWDTDGDYLLAYADTVSASRDVSIEYTSNAPNYSAPNSVYTSARFMNDEYSDLSNLTWLFPVDSGNFYLLRLYFCEFFLEIQNTNDRQFYIFINNKTAERNADVIGWDGAKPKVAVFKDYVAYVPDIDGRKNKQDLWLSMHPNMERGRYANVLLNGLEIFKLRDNPPNSNSLAAPNAPPISEAVGPERQPNHGSNKKKTWVPVVGVCGGSGVVLVMIILSFLIFRRSKDTSSNVPYDGGVSSLPDNLCRNFSIKEILSATRNFDDNFLIGVGGFGNVYKGCINNGDQVVAIKRLNPSSDQGEVEFLTEIKLLSKLRHVNLVPLIGYCVDKGEMILVYDYMPRGTLREHLYGSENSRLSWKQRLQICIGAAKGLDYLHTSAKHRIIHRDIKSTNILLDEKWVAKVSDFGLSKIGPIDGDKAYVSTAVKGSFGYVDPEYYLRNQLTEKSDVYSFGVVLFEVLCGRKAVIPYSATTAYEEVSLATWAHFCNKKGTIDQIVDPKVKGGIAGEALDKFVEIALKCLNKEGSKRPTMNDVVWSLQFTLELQESSEKSMNEHEEVLSPSVLHAALEDDTDSFSRSFNLAAFYSKSNSSVDFAASS